MNMNVSKFCAATGASLVLLCGPALAQETEFGIILQGAEYEATDTITNLSGDENGQAVGVVFRRTSPTASGFIGFQGVLALENTSREVTESEVISAIEVSGTGEISTDFSADALFLAGVNATDALSFYGGIGISAVKGEISYSISALGSTVSTSDSNIHFGPKVVLGLNYQVSEGHKVFAQVEHARYGDEDYHNEMLGVQVNEPIELDQTKFGVGLLFAF
ncbi:MAG: hypothetical protein GDA52_03700 [Rhodobacteraceae bacterium]|nr:hypothetical protein [Paracoccaceae bacterium]